MLLNDCAAWMPSIGKLRVVISENKQLLVEEHRGILEYADQRLVLGLEKGRLVISGQNIEIGEYTDRDIVVLGKIRSMEFME